MVKTGSRICCYTLNFKRVIDLGSVSETTNGHRAAEPQPKFSTQKAKAKKMLCLIPNRKSFANIESKSLSLSKSKSTAIGLCRFARHDDDLDFDKRVNVPNLFETGITQRRAEERRVSNLCKSSSRFGCSA
jgi:hypothetical protein